MYKRLYNHLLNQNILYRKQFGFQQGHSTEHAILQLNDQINDNWKKTILLQVFLLTSLKRLTQLTIKF